MLSRHLLKRFPSNITPVCRNVRLPHISQRFQTTQTPVRRTKHYTGNIQTPLREIRHYICNIQTPLRQIRHYTRNIQTPLCQIRHYICNIPPHKIFVGTATFGGVLGVIKGGLNIKNNYRRYSDRCGNPKKIYIFTSLLGSMVVGSVIIFLVPPIAFLKTFIELML